MFKELVVEPEEVYENLKTSPGKYKLYDVRRNDEFNDELGHAPGAILLTIDGKFESKITGLDKEKHYMIICRSGVRSMTACNIMQANGFKHVANVKGGMILWNKCGLPVEGKE